MTQALKMYGIPALAARAISGFASDNLTAAGTSQTDAFAMGNAINQFTTVAASTGALLPTSVHGDTIFVSNQGANSLSVYPPSGGNINNGSANAAFAVANGKVAIFRALNAINFVAVLSA